VYETASARVHNERTVRLKLNMERVVGPGNEDAASVYGCSGILYAYSQARPCLGVHLHLLVRPGVVRGVVVAK